MSDSPYPPTKFDVLSMSFAITGSSSQLQGISCGIRDTSVEAGEFRYQEQGGEASCKIFGKGTFARRRRGVLSKICLASFAAHRCPDLEKVGWYSLEPSMAA